MRLISRDPFARQELHRATLKTTKTCDWCGSTRKHGILYRYDIHTDGGTKYEGSRLFCCKGCHDTYGAA